MGVTALSPLTGTAIGYFEDGEVVVDQEAEPVFSEATGKRVKTLVAETVLGFEFTLIQFDTDALKKIWAATGNTLREPSFGGTVSPGALPAGSPVIFKPDDPQYPGIIIFNPAYRHGSKRIPHYLDEKRRERIFIDANDDANGHTWACDLLSALSLT